MSDAHTDSTRPLPFPDDAPSGAALHALPPIHGATAPGRPRGQGASHARHASSQALNVSSHALHVADAVGLLAGLPSDSVDLCITDPAYESLEKHRAIGTTTRLKHSKASSNDWYAIFPNARFPELFREVFRVLKRGSHFYLFCDQETMFVAKPLAEAAGFKFWKPLVWDKKMIGMGYHYRSRYELILFFEKGKRKLHDLSIPDILEAPRIRGGYPSEKPPEISRVLVEQSSEPGALVVDPFAGSGSVGVAALRAGRRFVGGDVCAEAVDIARARLDEIARASGAPLDRVSPVDDASEATE
jgi:site-specific DNA-methyltransferase (adenine-specific)